MCFKIILIFYRHSKGHKEDRSVKRLEKIPLGAEADTAILTNVETPICSFRGSDENVQHDGIGKIDSLYYEASDVILVQIFDNN